MTIPLSVGDFQGPWMTYFEPPVAQNTPKCHSHKVDVLDL